MRHDFLHQFAENPSSLRVSRSTFNRDFRHKTSFSEGPLVPFFLDEVLPGDTFNLKTSALIRLSNPAVRPVMDDMYLDYYYFFVPSRTLWKHFEEVHGDNKSSYWVKPTEFVVPTISPDNFGFSVGSAMDYFGVNVGVDFGPGVVSALPLGAYIKVWNEWFRDENFQSPQSFSELLYEASSGANLPVSDGFILSVNRYHDYFSSCLPAPQKGTAVSLPLGTTAPVTGFLQYGNVAWQNRSGSLVAGGGLTVANSTANLATNSNIYNNGAIGGLTVENGLVSGSADLSNATASTINALRQAFALQRMFEKDARGGTRYPETLKNHFGVSNGDARLQRSEFLGGKHMLLNMQQVSQTAPSSGDGNAVGQLGAYSLTGSMDGSFVKSFTEFGYVIGVCCVRVKHSYSQGLPRLFTRKRRFDYYYPGFANLGEQPVYTNEIYAGSGSNVFGFQEAWADYRYKPDLVTGALRPGRTVDFTAWTFGDHYTASPVLGGTWLTETSSNIDQTLRVPSTTAPQFIADFGVLNKCTRPMPLYSIPGLIDHN